MVLILDGDTVVYRNCFDKNLFRKCCYDSGGRRFADAVVRRIGKVEIAFAVIGHAFRRAEQFGQCLAILFPFSESPRHLTAAETAAGKGRETCKDP